MSQSFSLSRARCTTISDPALREEIHSYTGSELATTRILRSIDRFGTDPSIQRYEMTAQINRAHRSPDALGWTVRAVRLQAESQ